MKKYFLYSFLIGFVYNSTLIFLPYFFGGSFIMAQYMGSKTIGELLFVILLYFVPEFLLVL